MVMALLLVVPLCWGAIENDVLNCSDGKIWQCIMKRMDRPATLEPPSPQKGIGKFGPLRRMPTLLFSYLNRVNPDDGSIFLAARFKIGLQQNLLQNTTAMSLQILPKNKMSKPIYYRAQLMQRRSISDGYAVIDFTFPVENLLEYETNYVVKFDLLPLHLKVSGQKALFVPGYVLPSIDCNEDHNEYRQQIVTRFVGSFRQLTFYVHHSMATLSFYTAPKSYCLSYEIQLALGGSSVLVESHKISDLQEHVNSFALIGTVTLFKIIPNQNYSIRIIPSSATNSCVCLDCICMLLESQIFSVPDKAVSSSISKQLWTLTEQVLTIQIVDDRFPDDNGFMLIVFFCILSLTLIGMALIVLMCKTPKKPNTLILLKPANKMSQQEQLVPSTTFKKNQTVLLLNAEPSKTRLVDMLAKMLARGDRQIDVIYAEGAYNEIEKNIHTWCHNAVKKADKIILLHSHYAAYLIDDDAYKKAPIANQSAILDAAFRTMLSLVRINDLRFVHGCWENQRVSLFHNVETIYLFPRDLQYVFHIMNTSPPTLKECLNFKDEYQTMITKEAADKKDVALDEQTRPTSLFAEPVTQQAHKKGGYPQEEEEDLYDSKYMSMDTTEEPISMPETHLSDAKNGNDSISVDSDLGSGSTF